MASVRCEVQSTPTSAVPCQVPASVMGGVSTGAAGGVFQAARTNDGMTNASTLRDDRMGASRQRTIRGSSRDTHTSHGSFGRQWRYLRSTRTRYQVVRSEEHTSELQSPCNLVCRLLPVTKK